MMQVLCGTTEGDSQDRILAVQPRLRALGLQGDEVSAVLTALGASVPSLLGQREGAPADAPSRAWCRASARTGRTPSRGTSRTRWTRRASRSSTRSSGACASARVVFLFAARAGFTHPMESVGGHVALELGDLAPPDVERLVALRLGVDAVPEELMRFVRARAGGHPLFVEEVVKGLVEVGAVTVGDRRVVVDEARRAGARAAEDAARPGRVARRAALERGPRHAAGRVGPGRSRSR